MPSKLFEYLKCDALSYSPDKRIGDIVKDLIEHPKAIPPEVIGEYRSSDLRAEIVQFVNAYLLHRESQIEELTVEAVWFNQVVKWDAGSDGELSQKQRLLYRQSTEKLALGSRLVLESLVKKLKGLLKEVEYLEAAGKINEVEGVRFRIMILALEGMKALGRCDMLEHMCRVKEKSDGHDNRSCKSNALKKKFYQVTRQYLLEKGCIKKFSSVDDLADYLESDQGFIKLISDLGTKKCSWFYPAVDGRPDILISAPFRYQIGTWGTKGGNPLGWLEFLTPHQGRN